MKFVIIADMLKIITTDDGCRENYSALWGTAGLSSVRYLHIVDLLRIEKQINLIIIATKCCKRAKFLFSPK